MACRHSRGPLPTTRTQTVVGLDNTLTVVGRVGGAAPPIGTYTAAHWLVSLMAKTAKLSSTSEKVGEPSSKMLFPHTRARRCR